MNLQRGFSRVRLLPIWLLLHLTIITQTVSSETRVVCYYTNWSVYRPGTAKFSPQNINPYLCTHLIYAFGGFTKENSLKPFDKYQDIEKGGYAKFTGLKTYNKNLKTMLAIGGWNEGSSRFSPMVASGDRRKELVKNTIKFLRQNHFDGLDLDWEYPNFRDGGKSRDKDNYAQLVQELREEFNRESEKTGRPRLLLTMAVPAGIEYINKGYDVPKLMKYLDWMNILSYDYHSAFEPAVNHHSPLFPIVEDDEYNFEGDLNIDYTIKHYMKAGADPKKLVLGIPTYGRSYTLFNPDANELGAPADGPGEMGDATRENGYLAFYEICENIKDNDWTVMQPNPNAMGPYAYKENQWVSYDDEQIARKKSEYVVEMGLGGIMFWSIDNDDFRGNCYGKPYPLIEAAKEALINAASGKTDDNLVSAPSKPRKPITRGRTRPGISINSAGGASTQQRVQNSGGRQGSGDSSQNNGNSNAGTKKRIRLGSRNKARTEESLVTRPRGSSGRRRRPTTTTTVPTTLSTSARTVATTPMYKTPEPPTTPDPGGDFKCEEDGFFPHPRDCKKYFWCLSGPGDTGIIAHQFTCPAGLYFNKAADSCDYTQNVLCNKKVKTTTTPTSTTSTTTTTTTQRPSTTTRRTPARITAATSRTSFYYTTTTSTTPESDYYDEYEYEDEEFEDDVPPTIKKGELDAEEDPKVIKELIDLIRKVGGVEELEKYLKLQEDGSVGVTSSGSGSTTPATISRSLYERVLSRATANAEKTNTGTSSTSTITKGRGTLSYSILNRNSRPGPQSLGTASESVAATGAATRENSEDGTVRRVRPQYTTINRQRPSTERNVDEDDTELAVKEEEQIEEDVEEPVTRSRLFTGRKTSIPEYVTIRRTRPPSITENADEDEVTTKFIARGRQRGIPGETDVDETDVTQAPEYVTIRRSRPSIEEPTTSKYTTILRRRPSTETSENTVSSTDIPASQRRRPVPNEPDNLSFDDNGDSTKKRRPGSLINNDSTDVDISTDSILNQTDSESKRRGSGTSNNEEQSDSEVKRTRPVLTNVDDSKQFSNYDTIQRKPGNLNVEENTDRNSSTDSNIKHTIPTVQLINEEHQSSIKRPTTQSSISQDTTDVSFVEKEARRRGTTINYEDISSSRYRSTTLSAAESTTLVSDEKITLSITDNDTNTTEPGTATEITTYSIQDSSSTLSTEAITETTTGFSSSEGTTKSPSILTDRTNQIGDSDVSTSSEKATPQLFRPRPFATRNRSTTTVKPTTSEATEGAVRKVSDRPGLPSRGILRKQVQSGNKFAFRGQAQTQSQLVTSNINVDLDNSSVRSNGEQLESTTTTTTVETTTDRDEYLKRIRNRGKSRFTLPTSTIEPTVARRRRPIQGVTVDYEYDDEEQPHRTYRPTILADLSSLTSADIIFQRTNNRKHIRRRPTTSSQTSGTPTIITTTTIQPTTTEPNLKTGPRTLPVARKRIAESAFGRNTRRIIVKSGKVADSSSNSFNDATVSTRRSIANSGGNLDESSSTRQPFSVRTRPSYSTLFSRSSTSTSTPASEQQIVTNDSLSSSSIVTSAKNDEILNEIHTTEAMITTFSSVSTSASPQIEQQDDDEEVDSTESNSDKEYKTVKPDVEQGTRTDSNNEISEDQESTTVIADTLSPIFETSTISKTDDLITSKNNNVADERNTDDVSDGSTASTRSSIGLPNTTPFNSRSIPLRRLRPTTVPIPVDTGTLTSVTVSPVLDQIKPINRTRKVIVGNRRFRTTTISTIESDSETIESPKVRTRPSFISLRNNQARTVISNFSRSNVTRLKPVQFGSEEQETNNSSESNRGFIKRIRPIGIEPKVEEKEGIKLSETNISENDYLGIVRNLPEDDTGKFRRRKIVRRIRPGKDTVFSKSEGEDVVGNKGIRINDKSVLKTEQVITDKLTELRRIRLEQRTKSTENNESVTTVDKGRELRKIKLGQSTQEQITTTGKDEFENTDTEITANPKRIHLGKETFAKSESIDILRSKRIRYFNKPNLESNADSEQDKHIRYSNKESLETNSDEHIKLEHISKDEEIEENERVLDEYTTPIRLQPEQFAYNTQTDEFSSKDRIQITNNNNGEQDTTESETEEGIQEMVTSKVEDTRIVTTTSSEDSESESTTTELQLETTNNTQEENGDAAEQIISGINTTEQVQIENNDDIAKNNKVIKIDPEIKEFKNKKIRITDSNVDGNINQNGEDENQTEYDGKLKKIRIHSLSELRNKRLRLVTSSANKTSTINNQLSDGEKKSSTEGSSVSFKNRNLTHNYRPGQQSTSDKVDTKIKKNVTNTRLYETKHGLNRTRKIIRRFRPKTTTISSTTFEDDLTSATTYSASSEVPSTTFTQQQLTESTVTESLPISTTTVIEAILGDSTTLNSDDISATTQYTMTTMNNEDAADSTVLFTTEPETTTTTTPRPTRPSLIGRSRPAYKPKGRTVLDTSTATAIVNISANAGFKRRLNAQQEVVQDDGIVDDKLKKLYSKKQKYSPIGRTNAERVRVIEEERNIEASLTEDDGDSVTPDKDISEGNDSFITDIIQNTTDKITDITNASTPQMVHLTQTEDISDILQNTTDKITDITNASTPQVVHLTQTEDISENKQTTTDEQNYEEDQTVKLVDETTLVMRMIDNIDFPTTTLYPIEYFTEDVTISTLFTTENSKISEITTSSSSTEYLQKENIEVDMSTDEYKLDETNQTTTESTTEQQQSSETNTVSSTDSYDANYTTDATETNAVTATDSVIATNDNASNSSGTKSEPERSYKPFRYRPSDRPKLNIKLNRTELSESERQSRDGEQKNRKFTPSRTLNQRNRSKLAYRKDTISDRPRGGLLSEEIETTPETLRTFVPTDRKVDPTKPKSTVNPEEEQLEDTKEDDSHLINIEQNHSIGVELSKLGLNTEQSQLDKDDQTESGYGNEQQERQIKESNVDNEQPVLKRTQTKLDEGILENEQVNEFKPIRTSYPTLPPAILFNKHKSYQEEDTDSEIEEEGDDENTDVKLIRTSYPTLPPTIHFNILNKQQKSHTRTQVETEFHLDEVDYEDEITESPVRQFNHQNWDSSGLQETHDVVQSEDDDENFKDIEDESEEFVDDVESEEHQNIVKENNKSIVNRPRAQNIPTRVSNRPQNVPQRSKISNAPRKLSFGQNIPNSPGGVNSTFRSHSQNRPSTVNSPQKGNSPNTAIHGISGRRGAAVNIPYSPTTAQEGNTNTNIESDNTKLTFDIDQSKKISDIHTLSNGQSHIVNTDYRFNSDAGNVADSPSNLEIDKEREIGQTAIAHSNIDDTISLSGSTTDINRSSNNNKNYPRRFNKPIYPTSTPSTTTENEALLGIDIEALNARNKNLYNKNRKINVPHTGFSSSGSISITTNSTSSNSSSVYSDNVNNIDNSNSSSTLETSSENYVTTTQATSSSYDSEQILDDDIVPTTEQISTLHHVFAEPETPLTTVPSVTTTTSYNFTAAELEAARSLERVIEVNRIVEVSFKEDKVKNNSGVIESRTMLEKVPTLDRIRAVNRLTVINVVDGGNITNVTFPANHAVTLNEIITGRNLRTGQSVDIVAQLHAPDIQLTKMNILNNTLEIIEALKHAEMNQQNQSSPELTTDKLDGVSYESIHGEISSEQVTDAAKNSSSFIQQTLHPVSPTLSNNNNNDYNNNNVNLGGSPEISVNQPAETSATYGQTIELIETGNVKVVNGPKILEQLINDTVVVKSDDSEPKFEIYSKSNVVDYSHRDFNAEQILSTAQQGNTEISNKQGRKLAIDSKSVVVNNNNVRPVFNEITTLPIEALFHTESPDYNQLKVSVTELPTLKEVVTASGNYVDDDQDLLESKNVNGRVRIRILGQDDDYYKRYEVSDKAVFAPIRILKEETKVDNNDESQLMKSVKKNYKTTENIHDEDTTSDFLKQETNWNYSPHSSSEFLLSDKSTLKSSEAYTLKADVIEVTSKPQIEMIRIAPIEVSLSKSDSRVNTPVVRVESSQSSKHKGTTHTFSGSPKLNLRVLLDDETQSSSIVYPLQKGNQDSSKDFFNADVIFGELKPKTETQRSTA